MDPAVVCPEEVEATVVVVEAATRWWWAEAADMAVLTAVRMEVADPKEWEEAADMAEENIAPEWWAVVMVADMGAEVPRCLEAAMEAAVMVDQWVADMEEEDQWEADMAEESQWEVDMADMAVTESKLINYEISNELQDIDRLIESFH